MRLSLGNIPTTLKLIALDVGDDIAVSRAPELPEGWQGNEPTTQAVGNAWLDSGGGLVLRVPSALLPYATNYLINPAHGQAPTHLVEAEVRPFWFELRRIFRRAASDVPVPPEQVTGTI